MIAGTVEDIADTLQEWFDRAADGAHPARLVPSAFDGFVDEVVPEPSAAACSARSTRRRARPPGLRCRATLRLTARRYRVTVKGVTIPAA